VSNLIYAFRRNLLGHEIREQQPLFNLVFKFSFFFYQSGIVLKLADILASISSSEMTSS
jgi:hypothetical protein